MGFSSALKSLGDFLGPEVPLGVRVADLTKDSRYGTVLANSLESLRGEFGTSSVRLEGGSPRTRYYKTCRFLIYVDSGAGRDKMELAEGGDTNWTQALLNNSKERLVISGIGSERVCNIKNQKKLAKN